MPRANILFYIDPSDPENVHIELLQRKVYDTFEWIKDEQELDTQYYEELLGEVDWELEYDFPAQEYKSPLIIEMSGEVDYVSEQGYDGDWDVWATFEYIEHNQIIDQKEIDDFLESLVYET